MRKKPDDLSIFWKGNPYRNSQREDLIPFNVTQRVPVFHRLFNLGEFCREIQPIFNPPSLGAKGWPCEQIVVEMWLRTIAVDASSENWWFTHVYKPGETTKLQVVFSI